MTKETRKQATRLIMMFLLLNWTTCCKWLLCLSWSTLFESSIIKVVHRVWLSIANIKKSELASFLSCPLFGQLTDVQLSKMAISLTINTHFQVNIAQYYMIPTIYPYSNIVNWWEQILSKSAGFKIQSPMYNAYGIPNRFSQLKVL